MRTKTLLLTAALAVAGVATSMAQAVYSVNAVGYVNTTLKPGFSLISNPLTAANNSIAELFKGAPTGTQVYKFNGAGFDIATYDDLENAFIPTDVAAKTVMPGEGVFVRNPTAADVTFTFVGTVPEGVLRNPLPQGLSIRSSMVPQSGTAAELGLVGAPGDQLYQFDTTTGYYISSFDDLENAWIPPLKTLKVGEAFFLRKAAASEWTREFHVSPQQ